MFGLNLKFSFGHLLPTCWQLFCSLSSPKPLPLPLLSFLTGMSLLADLANVVDVANVADVADVANVADVADVADDEENRNVNEAADNSDTPPNSDGEWIEQDHREDPGSQEEARSHSRVGEACEAMVPTVKRKKIRLSMKKRKGILRSNQ